MSAQVSTYEDWEAHQEMRDAVDDIAQQLGLGKYADQPRTRRRATRRKSAKVIVLAEWKVAHGH